MNKRAHTVNMFAATSEDLPIFSGMALTQAAEMPETDTPQYTVDGMKGQYKGCAIAITLEGGYTIGPAFLHRVEVTRDGKQWIEHANTLELAQQLGNYGACVLSHRLS